MENFQYSVQLSDQDWAEFSATADECGLPQAGLASGDELLSSDIDQEDSSGPPGQPALGGRGLLGCEEEDVAAQQLVSRSQCEPLLALGAGEQTSSTSALSLGSSATAPSSALLVPVSCGDERQRLLQGPAPSLPGMSSWSPRSPGHNAILQDPLNNPGTVPRSSSGKKRRAMGAKAGGHSGAPGPAPAQLGSLLLTAQPEEGLGLAGPRGKSLEAGEVDSDEVVSISAPKADAAALSQSIVPQAEPHVVEMKTGVIPRAKPLAGVPGHFSGEHRVYPIHTPKKKKVRFSMAGPSPEKPASVVALGPPSPSTTWPSSPRTEPGGHEEPRTWDAVAIGPRPPKPRILKHLPPPAPSALRAPGPRSQFAVTLPEAYEFFFCDTIDEEEEEDAEEVALTSQALAEVQWPDICEFFFQDCQAQRPSPWGCCSLAPLPRAEAVLTPPPEDPVPISIPEAYEHFFREDRPGRGLGPSSLGAGPGPARAEQLGLMVRQPGELWGPLTSFTFSQNDMCLVFVAFATWAVRTSDLHSPDAWKTVLLANIGTISAIRHFRRQVGQGRCNPSPSRSTSS
ncbi:PGC-1 and ERR-induced regulator in muscle protein 1 [Otolemur garnettii]|uniref:PGC-1 and ERR-induced regulator in muscle protein 1 n=1 Tax=Otolemur garnettii TaxID=30611 RepID=UPI000C7F7736|nr:PGC-1 and ERR-induced regulator in muscle protein 1 [Otolemur garnettii]